VESDTVPFGFTEETIARGTGCLVYDGHAFADKAVE
jgi:hypothetical protein